MEPSSWDPAYGYVRFDLVPGNYDLKIGDLVSMTNGLITKEILIPSLAITDFNLGGDTVTGTFDPELDFWIGVNGADPVDMQFEGNTWTATFADLGPDMWGDAIQTDADGDEARATVHTPSPNFYAAPDQNEIFAQEWIAGFPLDLKIYDATGAEIYADSLMVNPPSEVPWTLVIFNTGDFDLLPEQRIVLSQRSYERELVVHHLQVTDINLNTQTISGIADPGQMFIGVNGTDMWIEVGADGTWEVSSPEYDSGEWGCVIIKDDDDDQTRDIFMIPLPE